MIGIWAADRVPESFYIPHPMALENPRPKSHSNPGLLKKHQIQPQSRQHHKGRITFDQILPVKEIFYFED